MQYFYDDGTLLIFCLENPKWTKELSSYFSNYNLKVGHETWICVNSLRLVNPHPPYKMGSLIIPFYHIFSQVL